MAKNVSKSKNARSRTAPRERPRGKFGFTVREAGKMVGLSPNSAYAAAKSGEIPTVRIGGIMIVPRALWLKKLGITSHADDGADDGPVAA